MFKWLQLLKAWLIGEGYGRGSRAKQFLEDKGTMSHDWQRRHIGETSKRPQ